MMGELLSEHFSGEKDSDHAATMEAAYNPFRCFIGRSRRTDVSHVRNPLFQSTRG